MGLSNGYAQMPWFLIFSILLALNGLILGHVWIAALSAFVCGFLVAERALGTEWKG